MIDILMATYNGEKYIAEQINSLICQTFKEWRLLIHDDGSVDDTIAIIKQFQEIDSRIFLIEDEIKFANAGNNFMHLLKLSTSEFIIFCDQDDIWYKTKLEEHFNVINNFNGPAMVYSNGYTFGKDWVGKNKFITFHRTDLNDSLFLNGGIHGCCTMINRLLLGKVDFQFPSYVFMHDHFITILAVTFGEVFYIDKPMMLYRQHENNVTGNINTSKISIIKSFLNPKNPVLDKRHYKANVSFFEKYEYYMNDKSMYLFKEYIKYPNIKLIDRLKTVYNNSFKVITKQNLLIKTIIRKPI